MIRSIATVMVLFVCAIVDVVVGISALVDGYTLIGIIGLVLAACCGAGIWVWIEENV